MWWEHILRQFDKASQPYILHPLTIMFKMNTTDEMIVAVLHDVVEDTDISLENLRDLEFSEDIVEAVDCLTKRDEENREDYLKRLKSNPIASRVKVEDLLHNMDLSRVLNCTEKDFKRNKRYQKELNFLTGEIQC